MPIFITQGRYTQQALEGMIEQPEDRAEAVGQLMKAVDGRLIDYYLTFGDYDFMVITEAPSIDAVASAMLAAGASNRSTALKTTVALSATDAMGAFEGAQKARASYRAAGGAT